MAVYLYSGTPGSGKSFHSIEAILRYLSAGKVVICNFPIKFTKWEMKRGFQKRFIYMETLEIRPEKLIEIRNRFVKEKVIKNNKEDQVLCMFDECSIMFNPRDFSRKDRMDWINFLSQHRHYGFQVCLIAQIDRMIDRQIRGLIENEIKHRKLNNLSFPFVLFPLEILIKAALAMLGMSIFIAITYWYPVKMKMEARPFLFRKSVAKHYSTFYDFRKMQEEAPAEAGDRGSPPIPESTGICKKKKFNSLIASIFWIKKRFNRPENSF
jgi:hypothetical protein